MLWVLCEITQSQTKAIVKSPRYVKRQRTAIVTRKDIDPTQRGTLKQMRPKGAPHIENVRFWELSDHSLRFIAKDAFTAERANPDGPKALTYLDEINDACTVMSWRKKLSEPRSVRIDMALWREKQ